MAGMSTASSPALGAHVEQTDPIAEAKARRAREEATVRSRVAYALTAHQLGEPGPLVGLGRELAAGTLDLGPPRPVLPR